MFSNHAPEPTGDAASISRMLPISVKPLAEEDKLSEDDVWEKVEKVLPQFIGYCIDAWAALGGRPIPLQDSTGLVDAVGNYEHPLQMIFDEYFVLDSGCVGKQCVLLAKDYTKIWALAQEKFPQLTQKNKGGYISSQKFAHICPQDYRA